MNADDKSVGNAADGDPDTLSSAAARFHYGLAIGHYKNGKVAEAIEELNSATNLSGRFYAAWLAKGSLFLQNGAPEKAIESYAEAINSNRDGHEALYYRGLALQLQGLHKDAVGAFTKAKALCPTDHAISTALAFALQKSERFEEALREYEFSLSLRAGYPNIWIGLAQTQYRLGRYDDAFGSAEKALGLNPVSLLALEIAGDSKLRLDDPIRAAAFYAMAASQKPEIVPLWRKLAVAQLGCRRYHDASISFKKILEIENNDPPAIGGYAYCLERLNCLEEALGMFRRAAELDPHNAEIFSNLGIVLFKLKRPADALPHLDTALSLNPNLKSARYLRAHILKDRRPRLALKDIRMLSEPRKEVDFALGDLLHMRSQLGIWKDYHRLKSSIDQGVRNHSLVVTPFVYQSISDSPADLLECAKLYIQKFAPSENRARSSVPRMKSKIRVGYVSGEFRTHATSHLAAGLFDLHDKNRFEILAFDNGKSDDSEMRQRLERSFSKIVKISHLSDSEAAEEVSSHDIDILVDLNVHFGDSRHEMFALRPAPIQINYLGFPGTSGAPYMDYIIADRWVAPYDEARYFSEKIVYLPDSYQVNDCLREQPKSQYTRKDCNLPDQGRVFCCFNQSYKITPSVFADWMQILHRVENSILWLWNSVPVTCEAFYKHAERHGIDRHRIVMAPTMRLGEHISRLQLADLFLDTAPCNAHTSASDALWAGVPVLTRRGTTFAGRVAESLLRALDLPELIADNRADYISKAVNFGNNPELHRSVVQKLRRNKLTGPLFNTKRSCRHIEMAYETMVEMSQHGEFPQSFSVVPAREAQQADSCNEINWINQRGGGVDFNAKKTNSPQMGNPVCSLTTVVSQPEQSGQQA